MRKHILAGLIISSILCLSACQNNTSDNDTSKIQESIEKIKAKIQENLSSDKTTGENQIKDKGSEEKDNSSNKNEPNSAD